MKTTCSKTSLIQKVSLLLTIWCLATWNAQPAIQNVYHKDNALIVGCIIIGVGGIIYIGLSSLCKRIPELNPPPPPVPTTNIPITRVNWTNAFPPNWRGGYPPPGFVSPKGLYSEAMPFHVSSMTPVPFDSTQWEHSPMSGARPPLVACGSFDTFFSVTLESTTDLTNWTAVCQTFVYQCTVSNLWFEDGGTVGPGGSLVNTYVGRYDVHTNNKPIFSGYRSDVDNRCDIPMDLLQITNNKPQEFFRWSQP